MSKKAPKAPKGKGGKKGDTKEVVKLTNVDRQFYELTIADLNKKLATLTSQYKKIEEENVQLQEAVEEMDDDKNDLMVVNERMLDERDELIIELESKVQEVTKQHVGEASTMKKQYQLLENKYDSMRNQLQSQIRVLNAQLTMLKEYRKERHQVLASINELAGEINANEQKAKDMLHNCQRKAAVEQDQIKKAIAGKLESLTDDLLRSQDTRHSAFTGRLIHENNALQTEIETLIKSHLKLTQEFESYKQRSKEWVAEYKGMKQTNFQLMKSSNHQIKIIEKLTTKCEELKAKNLQYSKYKQRYEELLEVGACERFEHEKVAKKLRFLGIKIDELTKENKQIILAYREKDLELLRMNQCLDEIEQAVKLAIGINVDGSRVTSRKVGKAEKHGVRKNLLTVIEDILSKQRDLEAHSVSSGADTGIYRVGNLGFIKTDADFTIMDVFATDEPKEDTNYLREIEMEARKLDPEKELQRQQEAQRLASNLVDVEKGLEYFVSSSHEELEVEVPQDDEKQSDEEDEGTDSSDYGQPDAEQQSTRGSKTSKHSIKSTGEAKDIKRASAVEDIAERRRSSQLLAKQPSLIVDVVAEAPAESEGDFE